MFKSYSSVMRIWSNLLMLKCTKKQQLLLLLSSAWCYSVLLLCICHGFNHLLLWIFHALTWTNIAFHSVLNILLLSCYNFRTRAWLSESSQHSKPEVEEWVSHFPQHHTSGTVPGICHDQLCRLPRLTRLDPMLAKCDISKPVKGSCTESSSKAL